MKKMIWVSSGLALNIGLCLMIVGCTNNAQEATKGTGNVVSAKPSVTAPLSVAEREASHTITIDTGQGEEDLVALWRSNAALVNEKVQGKIITVRGVITNIGQDGSLGLDSKVLIHPDTDPTGKDWGTFSVIAMRGGAKVNALSVGQTVTLQGRGRLLDTGLPNYTVFLDDWTIVSPSSSPQSNVSTDTSPDVMEASAFSEEYRKNRADTVDKYNGKTLSLRGKIDVFSEYGGISEILVKADAYSTIIFQMASKGEVAGLHEGDVVTVRGTYHCQSGDMLLGLPLLHFENCRVIQRP